MSSTKPRVNLRSTSVKRILQEQQEFQNEIPPVAGREDEEAQFHAAPLEEDVFEWHVTVRGAKGTDYEGGIYHLRITLPPNYPMSAPDILLLTPSGRFETNKKICIDGLTSFHQGSWRPAWGVRTAIVGLVSFWNQQGEALSGVGALNYTKEEKRRLAGISGAWTCPTCQQSNSSIMHEYVEELKSKRIRLDAIMEEGDDGASATLVDSASTLINNGDASEVEGKGKMREPMIENEKITDTPRLTPISPEIPVSHPIPTQQSPLDRARDIAADRGHPDLPLSTFQRLILTPAPRYLPICYTLQFIFLSLFLPARHRHLIPPAPDHLLLLDALIHLLAISCTLLVFSQMSRLLGLTRLYWKSMHRIFTSLEWILGIQLGFTKRFAARAEITPRTTSTAVMTARRGGGSGAGGGARAVGEIRGLKPEVLDAMQMDRGRLRRAFQGVGGGAGMAGVRVGEENGGGVGLGGLEEL